MKCIPVNEPLLNGNEKKYIEQCLETGWISSEGPFVQSFEEELAKSVGRKYGVAVCNGTAALELAVLALGIEKGSEVILPSFTIVSCAQAVVRAGLIPVAVDSDGNTWNMDIGLVEEKITSRTRAIMAVHIYGLPVDMDPLLDLAAKYNLKIIEDAAQMHGQTYKGTPCGCFGDISTFSFYPNKHITTGEGGMILTNDIKVAERCKALRNLCHSKERRFVHYELGYNYRMTNLQAALGLAQLEKLGEHITRKREMGARYTALLRRMEFLQLPVEATSYASNIYWVFGVVVKTESPLSYSDIISALKKKGIGTRPFFYPMHKQPVFQDMGLFEGVKAPVAERLGENGFYLPSGLNLTDGDIEYVANTVLEILDAGKEQL